MINEKKNAEINERLRSEYRNATAAFLSEWAKAFTGEIPPCRINEFGIIDESRYDTDNGVLFICKETNGWKNEDYEAGTLFRGWMAGITKNGLGGGDHISQHPNMWYNIGRWAILIENPNASLAEITKMKSSAVAAIGNIAFTNINKARGRKKSKREYLQLAKSKIAGDILRRELEIINPSLVVCCGTYHLVVDMVPEYTGRMIVMPHPGARKGTFQMLSELHTQLIQKEEL